MEIFLLSVILMSNIALLVILIAVANFLVKIRSLLENKPVIKPQIRSSIPENLMEIPTPYFSPSPQKLDKGF